jgi:CHAT domain-containing protein/tetratricopeptide (TPR) repeat protein
MNSSRLKLIAAALLLCLIQIFPQNAIAQVTETLQISQSVSEQKTEADRLFQQGVEQYQSNQFQAALQALQQALGTYQEIGDRAGEGKTLVGIGAVYSSLGQYSQALEKFQQVLVISREMSDRAQEGTTLNNMGAVYRNLGQYPQALEHYQQALVIDREIDNRASEGITLNNIGEVYTNLGQYPQALEKLQQALAILSEVGNRAGEGTTFNNIGEVYGSLGQYPQALEKLQRALVISREIGDRAEEGTVLNNIGSVYSSLGQYLEALNHYQKAATIANEVSDRAGEGTVLNNIGIVYSSLGQYQQAIGQYQQALVIFRELNDRVSESTTLNNLGLFYKLGQHSQAIEYLQQALAISREIKDPVGEGITLNNMGEVYRTSGQYPQATEHFQQALAISREVIDPLGEGTALNNIGEVYRNLGQFPQAVEQYQQALVIFRNVGDPASASTVLSNLGQVLLLSGDVEAGGKALFEAIETSESLRSSELPDAGKVSLLDTQLGTYGLLQEALVAQNQSEAALEVAERGRARAFAELLDKRSSSPSDSSAISTAVPSLAQIKQIAHEQNSTLVEYSIIRELVNVEGQESWQPSELYIWVVKPTGEINFRSVDLTLLDVPLNELMKLSRQAVGANRGPVPLLPPPIGRQPEQTADWFQQLYQVLIEPIADLLPANPNDPVIFIPQGELFQVPFPALQEASGQYLIENYTILTAPSIQVLGLTQSTTQAQSFDPSEVLIVGNPTLPSLSGLLPQSLSSLPGAEQEAIAIAQQFGTQPLLGDAATETAVVQRMAKARVIHLATHGLLEYGNPETSGVRDVPGAIALAPSAEADGLLTSSEILNLELNDSLIVLSACDTARGDITGDGVIGLSRSLLSAGASTVVVSLWKVPDDATAVLMTEFYTQLQQQPDRAQALRQAMLKTMAEYPDPVDWAAFTLIGETYGQ